MNESYKVLFHGEIIDGIDRRDVQRKLAQILHKEEQDVTELFSGESVIIKQSSDLADCQALQRAFLSIGLIATIVDENEEETEEDPLFPQQPQARQRQKKEKKTFKKRLSGLAAKIKPFIIQAKEKILLFWREGSESLRSDMEIDGMSMVVKNRFFLQLAAVVFILLIIFIAALLYTPKTMPLKSKNYSEILNHMLFIDMAFTREELHEMKKDKRNFLDYQLIDPVAKMGYQFAPTIKAIAREYLDDDMPVKDLQTIKPFLTTAARERDNLLEYGFITPKVKETLDAVAEKMNP